MTFAGLLKSRDQNIAALSAALDSYGDEVFTRVRQMADRGDSLIVPLTGGGNTASDKLIALLSAEEQRVEKIQQEVLEAKTLDIIHIITTIIAFCVFQIFLPQNKV
jgi:hypothetical protein